MPATPGHGYAYEREGLAGGLLAWLEGGMPEPIQRHRGQAELQP